ncbi:NADH:flavin oxidoreductase [Agrobacterium tumefaciens]|uniref:NADH:flavin oxidoreductase n=1 Tax=Agrobacterium tumefaciens TaxID=358 RepID=UPI0015724DAB|nr:NADH:flavin oxidoreductase [Agrobacterium tumefaciens]NTD87683.1 NADH:flavin oxidoreductase [Agrobacterium tumefaciens]NTD91558.1 NADH:flavin oxidoreductase [Agrobacterium tumefaciens]NTD95543.1 NADH:flavin oxidoreductase [Agrobacterium tumefaciens]NTE11653.1 NADH:flavin oxidoreductase [Agrobacterium tumefaciens]NTE25098.1 NADH:flavin oxidoreductase [Agrobacterium tumefaciens]
MSTLDTSSLFRPITIRSLELKNRIVMAPMTRLFAPEGVPGQASADYYGRRAQGRVGLILSEGTVIDRPASRNDSGIPFFHGNEALHGWKNVIDAVHGAGGRMGPQIWHTGATRYINGWEPDAPVESPSGLDSPGDARGVAMTEQDIADTVAAFARAAADAKKLGFDTVEIHGAHGYLIDQFFWAGTNLRSDRYGGPTIKERSRFAIEIVTAVREAVGPDFPIIMRVSQWKQQDFSVRLAETPEQMETWLSPLVEAGVDVLHVSQRRFWEPEFPEIDGENGLNGAGWAKKVTGAVTIGVGSVGLDNDVTASAFVGKGSSTASLDRLIDRMEREEFDLIALGRVLLSDPDWVAKVEDGNISSLKGFDPSALAELV